MAELPNLVFHLAGKWKWSL